jgi:hypothetical protein
MRPHTGALALVASLALLAPGAAIASNVSASELQSLAGQAAGGDANALAQLRQVDQVDGQPAAVAAALQTSDETQLHSRLAALATPHAPAGASALSATQAQATASAILAAGRYSKAPVPDPVGSVFDKLGRWLGKVAADAPGGPVAFWGVLGALVLALGTFAARRTMRRLDPAAARLARTAESRGEDPAALEQEAQAAEARGAFADAVRLRFRAGLLQLSFRGALDYRPSLLTADARRRLHSPQFDSLAGSFERIAYGGAPAAEADAAAARDGWRRLLSATPRQ